MVDFSIVDKSLKAAWVKRFHEADRSKWCSVFASVTVQYGGRFIFECNYDTRYLNLTSRLPSFYKDILTVWRLYLAGGALSTPPRLWNIYMTLFGVTVSSE